MPSDSIAGFLDKARANRVLFPEQVEQLIRQPDIPQSDLNALCAYLEDRGALTRFQADMLRGGRGSELTFASYPVIDEIGPCPGGTAYRVLHPSLRTPLVLRRFRTDALLPADNPAALIQRARAFTSVHPHLVTLVDAGFYQDEPYATLEPPIDWSTLDILVREIGPTPGFLAAGYGQQVASALRVVDERGMWHGDIRPVNLLVGPMAVKTSADGTVKRRPAPNATVKVAELGLVPIRPPAASAPPPLEQLAYLPPERVDGGVYSLRGDLYGLGASLYYLLTGRPPFTGSNATEVMDKIRTSPPAPLAALRPELPAEFVALVHQLLSKRPEDRPPTAWDVETALAKFCRPGSAPAPASAPGVDGPAATFVPVTETAEAGEPVAEILPNEVAPADEWGAGEAFSTSEAAAGPVQRKPRTEKEKARTRLLVILGLILHFSAVTFCLAAFVFNVFDRTSVPDPIPAPTKKDTNKKDTNKKDKRAKPPDRGQ